MTLHIPRKGMETVLLISAVARSPLLVDITYSPQGDGNTGVGVTTGLPAMLTLHIPRKGMETYLESQIEKTWLTVDITYSPQGDGNLLFHRKEYL